MENAQITKDEENKTIHVFSHKDSIEIMLSNESVLLKIGDGGHHYTYDLWVKEENGIHDVYNKKHGTKYDISERYYAAYGLSIKNIGSNPIDFKLNGLHLHDDGRIFNTTSLEPYDKNSSLLEVLQYLEKENKLQDTTLLPGQSLNGIVAFRVNSLFNKSFMLKYDTTALTSASFEKSIEALAATEYFNYSVALGIPPYNLYHLNNSYEPIFDNYNTWANWVNRSIIEIFRKSDLERMQSRNTIVTTIIILLLLSGLLSGYNITKRRYLYAIFGKSGRLWNHDKRDSQKSTFQEGYVPPLGKSVKDAIDTVKLRYN